MDELFQIDRIKMDNNTRIPNAKINPGKNNSSSEKTFKNTIWNIIDKVGEFSIYEMSHWNNNIDRWLRNRSYENMKPYKRGSIVLVDLGASNFKYEPSFSHPCIVLDERQRSILVAPCSTKKFGKGYREIIDANAGIDGFAQNTGVQVEELRWINKNRVISKLGKTSSRILNEIDFRILKSIPSYRKELSKFNSESEQNKQLLDKNNELSNKIIELENKIKELNEKIGVLKSEKDNTI